MCALFGIHQVREHARLRDGVPMARHPDRPGFSGRLSFSPCSQIVVRVIKNGIKKDKSILDMSDFARR